MRKNRRTVKYKRVSHKEQAINGFSLQAQNEVLDEYIEKNNLHLVGDYEDKGVSASTTNRPALQQLLEDVKDDKIDLIIFTKLDRWFRSVSDYYEIQKILDQHDVVWRTVQEDYNTETGDGRFKVNIMLSVAQQELDRTSERIKVVIDSKVKNKQAITGALPIGYKLGVKDGKKIVIKDKSKKEMVLDVFTHFEIHQSIRATMEFVNDTYNTQYSYNTYKNMLANSLYAGEYRNVESYCEAYISKEKFNKIQKLLKGKKQVKKYKNVYLFSTLIKCPCCNGTMSGNAKDGQYLYYRCNKAILQKRCEQKFRVSERKLEAFLLNNIEVKLAKYIITSDVKDTTKKKPKYDKGKINAEIARIKRMYKKGHIDDHEYDRDYEKLQRKLRIIDEQTEERDLEPLKEFLKSDFKTIYKSLTKEEKRSMWRSIIKEMVVHDHNNVNIEFV